MEFPTISPIHMEDGWRSEIFNDNIEDFRQEEV